MVCQGGDRIFSFIYLSHTMVGKPDWGGKVNLKPVGLVFTVGGIFLKLKCMGQKK